VSAPAALDELVETLKHLPEEERERVAREAAEATGDMVWVPSPGPQSDAYFSHADILLYGGQAGGGKSQLVIGWGVNEASNGMIFRRELSQADGLERDGRTIIGNLAGYNGSDHEWTWSDGRSLKIGGMRDADSWIAHAGRERDYMAFDEAGEFLEVQVASILAWLRAEPGRRTRLILASNPPRSSDGLWLIEWFAPWLDKHHHLYPTPPGDLRWAFYANGRTIWVDGPGEHKLEGETYIAKSRTFIPASLEDNPYRNTPEYRAQLQSLPEPLRSQLLYGDFEVGLKDDANQAIPTAWVRAAMARRSPRPPQGARMCAIGVDASGGGEDPMVQAIRYDGWFDELVKTPGADIPQDRAGSYAAGVVLTERQHGALIVVDLGGGYGGPLYEHLKANNIECRGFKGAESTNRRSRAGNLAFVNKRSAAYWLFREALDPDQPGGSPIQLPRDPRLLAGLTAPRFEVTPNGIRLEAKSRRASGGTPGVKERLGFSPDEADAVVMAWFEGPRFDLSYQALDLVNSRPDNRPDVRPLGRNKRGQQPVVVMGRRYAVRHRR
jgi:hypothetical protein